MRRVVVPSYGTSRYPHPLLPILTEIKWSLNLYVGKVETQTVNGESVGFAFRFRWPLVVWEPRFLRKEENGGSQGRKENLNRTIKE